MAHLHLRPTPPNRMNDSGARTCGALGEPVVDY